jgi:hypothetical protein
MTIFGIRDSAIGDPDDLGEHRLAPTSDPIHLDEPALQLPRAQPLKVVKVGQLNRTHVRMVPSGCHTEVRQRQRLGLNQEVVVAPTR